MSQTTDENAAEAPDETSVSLEEAPTTDAQGNELPTFRIAMSVVVDSQGLDAADAIHRALAAMGMPSGPFRHGRDRVVGRGGRFVCRADVVSAEAVTAYPLEEEALQRERELREMYGTAQQADPTD